MLRSTPSGSDLVWRRPDPTRALYELASPSRGVLARLELVPARAGAARAEFGDAAWTFESTGALARHITILPEVATDPALRFDVAPETGDGVLALPEGREVYWVREQVRFPSVTWRWQDSQGRPLLTYVLASSLRDARCTVSPEPASVDIPQLDLLILLGWFVLVLRIRRTRASLADQ